MQNAGPGRRWKALPVHLLAGVLLAGGGCGKKAQAPKPARAPAAPWLLVFHVEVQDDLSTVAWRTEASPVEAPDPSVRRRDGQALCALGSIEALVARAGVDPTVGLGPGVRATSDVKAVIVTTIDYLGKARKGHRAWIELVASPTRGPSFTMPARIDLGVMATGDDLDRVLPWPEHLAWDVREDGRLVVRSSSGGERVLGPGESAGPFSAEATATLRRQALKPVAMEAMGENRPLEIEWKDLGAARFRSAVTLRFEGRVRMEDAP